MGRVAPTEYRVLTRPVRHYLLPGQPTLRPGPAYSWCCNLHTPEQCIEHFWTPCQEIDRPPDRHMIRCNPNSQCRACDLMAAVYTTQPWDTMPVFSATNPDCDPTELLPGYWE